MKAIGHSFTQMLATIKGDFMLAAACLAPVIAGVFFKLGIPAIERLLRGWLGQEMILAPYYSLIDVFFASLAPAMFCFATAMVILEERDDHIAKYLFITPLGKNGYLLSRMGLPAAAAFLFTVVLLPLCSLSDLTLAMCLLLSVGGALQGVIIALLIAAVSGNKLEGMAVTKLATLLLLGALAPYFVHGKGQFLLAFLPSFWMGRAAHEGDLLMMLPGFLVAMGWIVLLQKPFLRKMIG